MQNEPAAQLTVSVVVYHLESEPLHNTLHSLQQAVQHAQQQQALADVRLVLVDNHEQGAQVQALQAIVDTLALATTFAAIDIISGHGNVGYGRGHNLAILTDTPANNALHLILNPDVEMAPDALLTGINWLQQHPGTIAVAPTIEDPRGVPVSACKRDPSVLDFALRGFAPAPLKRLFARRLARYDMHDLSRTRPTPNIPIISGCFMLFRASVLRELRGFDPNYFLYFEDFDLSVRARALGSLTYVPAMHIRHLGGHTARKGLRHIRLFAQSAWRFFNSHGWRLV